MYKLFFSAIVFVLFASENFAQKPKNELKAVKTTATFIIDGELKEPEWKQAEAITGLIQFRPNFGEKELEKNKSEIYLLYDNNYIYMGGYLHEGSMDSISRELVGRDRIGNSDFVGLVLDTYNTGINGVGFYTTPYGEQFDARYSNGGEEDDKWNAVWKSDAKLQANGWSFEMRIPYSALRFSNSDNQTWGLNIIRKRQKSAEQFSWAPLDPDINGFINQQGHWTGIEKIKAPLRLSFSPYFSAYVNHYPYKITGLNDLTTSFNGGMDVKYGITESFTLDMTLIPDFGQVQSDDRILNLSPFEVEYNENRSFFTEGTELFSKGDIFYSRRIGGTPIHFDEVYASLDSSETILKNPTESKLLNATKISGRTSKGLGLGILNAITKPMYAVAKNGAGKTREIQTNPLTNYNVLVIDQSLKNNSSVSFINTNVWRKGKDYDANVSALVADINDKKKIYNWNGSFNLSNIIDPQAKTVTGYSHELGFAKRGGRFNFELFQELETDQYNINDLGLLFANNSFNHFLWMGYKWLKPKKWYKNIRLNVEMDYSRRFKPGTYQGFQVGASITSLLKNLNEAGTMVEYTAPGNDFYEPRHPGRFFKTGSGFFWDAYFSSNRAKRYFYFANISLGTKNIFNGYFYRLRLENNYRFNDKFSVGHEIGINPFFNEAGFADFEGNNIIFSRRDVKTIENNINSKYNFNKRHGISFDLRHYWSEVESKQYYTLQNDGTLLENNNYQLDKNKNFNAFTIDMVYTWEFAPGSFINVVWKNSIYHGSQQIHSSYFKNLNRTISAPQNNSLSLKVIYYLDVIRLKKK